MAANKLINLIAISSLAILACTFAPAQVNALSTGYHHVNHHVAHEGIAKRSKRKRQQSQRCKQRPSSSSAAPTSTSWTPPPSPTTTWVPTTSAAPPAPAPPPPPSSSWSPIPSPSPSSSGGSGSGKVGIAWNNGDESWLANFKTPATRFVYTWSEYKPSNADSLGFEFWPMLWGPSHVDSFNQLVVAGYGTTILGFNEPEISGQSNIDPQTAASLWQQNIQPKKQLGYNLISPAVTSDAAGIPWLQQFFQACQGCTVSLGRCSQMTPLIACISSMGSLCTGTALIRMLSCPMSRTFTPHSTFRFILPSSRIRTSAVRVVRLIWTISGTSMGQSTRGWTLSPTLRPTSSSVP
ncbi:hypothetical protein AcW2_006498 [Taiwanofungus camphoratus]|nr:hypothetical protein AcW2_006498 [Antrodia cinnamomea]